MANLKFAFAVLTIATIFALGAVSTYSANVVGSYYINVYHANLSPNPIYEGDTVTIEAVADNWTGGDPFRFRSYTFLNIFVDNMYKPVASLDCGAVTTPPQPPCSIRYSATYPVGIHKYYANLTVRSSIWQLNKTIVRDPAGEGNYKTFEVLKRQKINATIRCEPLALNLKSKGNWITCHIKLPKPYNSAGIDVNSVLLNGAVENERNQKYGFVKNAKTMVKFDRDAVQNWLVSHGITSGTTSFTITGKTKDGKDFEGNSNEIKILDKGKKGKKK